MAIVFADSFTESADTNLESHTPDSDPRAAWQLVADETPQARMGNFDDGIIITCDQVEFAVWCPRFDSTA